MEASSYAKFLDNFGSEIGTTLEDLATDWAESEYDFADDSPAAAYILRNSRSSSFQSRGSMDSLPGITDWSLKKAKPLAFSNPVYHLLLSGEVVSKPRQMKLIPLNQFEINKNQDSSIKKQKKGIKAKLSNLTIRRSNSAKKHEPEMHVTAPLWTDAPTVIPSEPRIRSRSLLPHLKNGAFDEIPETETDHEDKQEINRPLRLDLTITSNSSEALKPPPVKTPRTSKGNFNPLEDSPSTPIVDNNQEVMETDASETVNIVTGSTTSLASNVSEECPEEDQKTMIEVMQEIDEDSSSTEKIPSHESSANQYEDDEPRLKRNKTLKWSGSRAAPALIREFTRKSRKQARPSDVVSLESPNLSSTESPSRSSQQDDVNKLTKSDKLASAMPKKRDSLAFTVLSSLLPPAPKLKRSESTKIRMYIHKMGTNIHNALGYATTEFVKQTMQSSEYRPMVILHSIRSFLTDIKKYLITNPHVGLMSKIQKIIKNMPMSDVEGAIDDALERLVLYPLRDFIYKRLVLNYARSGRIRIVEDAIQIGQTKSTKELGVRETLIPPNDEAMEMVRQYFLSLQATYSPYYKLKHLLSAVTTIYENTLDETCEDQSARKIGADDFLPLLVHAIVKCDFAAADIEAQYIDGLLDPALLLGEGGYYLTTLISAVQVLSSIKKRESPLPNVSDLQGFLKVGISSKVDDTNSVLMHKTLHVPPSMTASNLGSMIAKKFGIKQSKRFCLHVVVNSVAYPLKAQEFPQLVKMDLLTQFSPESFFFVYRQSEKACGGDRPTTLDSESLIVNSEEGEEIIATADLETERNMPTDVTSPAEESTAFDVDADLTKIVTTPEDGEHELDVSMDDTTTLDDVVEKDDVTSPAEVSVILDTEADLMKNVTTPEEDEHELDVSLDDTTTLDDMTDKDDVTSPAEESAILETEADLMKNVTTPDEDEHELDVSLDDTTTLDDMTDKDDVTSPAEESAILETEADLMKNVTTPDEDEHELDVSLDDTTTLDDVADKDDVTYPAEESAILDTEANLMKNVTTLEEDETLDDMADNVISPQEETTTFDDARSTQDDGATPPANVDEYTATVDTLAPPASPGRLSQATSDGDFYSDDDIVAGESYLQGTRVDDVIGRGGVSALKTYFEEEIDKRSK